MFVIVCSTLMEMSYSDSHKAKMYANPLTPSSLYIMDYFILQNAVESPACIDWIKIEIKLESWHWIRFLLLSLVITR